MNKTTEVRLVSCDQGFHIQRTRDGWWLTADDCWSSNGSNRYVTQATDHAAAKIEVESAFCGFQVEQPHKQ
ncbi:hypothetical protein KJ596_01230 [Patescibacteria group bacterium]|nr:hypothetical protein [Patescibacteria group bacterium]MBU1868046.1 hypothetical protein [Patescibacteria group bacterium]